MIRTDARKEAAQVLVKVAQDNAYVNILFNELAQSGRVSPEEFPVVQRMVRGALEHQSSIDARIALMLHDQRRPLPHFVQAILRIALYQLRELDRIPAHAVVNESVGVIKNSKFSGFAALVNAVLRREVREALAEMHDDAPKEKARGVEEIAEHYSHPLWIVERWATQFGLAEAEALCRADNEPWALCLRVNTLRLSALELQKELTGEGIATRLSSYARDCLIVEALPKTTRLNDLASFKRGLFLIQDESSILVTEVLAPQPGERILDLCAAPGGKTCSIALQMGNTGEVIAVDVNEKRLMLVRENCARLGITNVRCEQGEGQSFTLDGGADGVLVDAPCSGLGVLGRKADARWNKSLSHFEKLLPLQEQLLAQAALSVRVSARLVYSTCSIDREEDEVIIDSFIRTHPQWRNVPPALPSPLITVQGYFRSWPHHHHIGGAFAAKLIR